MQKGESGAAANGLFYAFGCYAIWGVLPLYFKLLQNVGPLEIVSQRLLWSLLLILLILSARAGLGAFIAILRNRRLMLPLSASAALIAVNWLIYVWAVQNNHVVAASLGYFLNPLVNILLGFLFLNERLRRGQMIAVAIAAIGVAILAAVSLNALWISLMLGITFGLYGLIRKVTPVGGMQGLGAETLLLTPPAVIYLLWLNAHGGMMFGNDLKASLLLITAGGLTTVALSIFAMAAQRLPLVTMGVIQYLSPTLQFLIGVFLFKEPLSSTQLVSFLLIWGGLILFTIDSLRAVRAARMAPVQAAA